MTPEVTVEGDSMLEWDSPKISASAEGSLAVSMLDAVPVEQDTEPMLSSADVQMQLAIEFRGLGLWEESRARLLEILEQPDSGLHAPAQTMLEELAEAAPESLPPLDRPT